MRAEARRIVANLPDAAPTELIAVGGTASNLLRVLPPSAVDRESSIWINRVATPLGSMIECAISSASPPFHSNRAKPHFRVGV